MCTLYFTELRHLFVYPDNATTFYWLSSVLSDTTSASVYTNTPLQIWGYPVTSVGQAAKALLDLNDKRDGNSNKQTSSHTHTSNTKKAQDYTLTGCIKREKRERKKKTKPQNRQFCIPD